MKLQRYDDLTAAQRQEVGATYRAIAVSDQPSLMHFYITKRGRLAKRKKPVSMLAMRWQRELLEQAKLQASWSKRMAETVKFYEGKT